MDQTENKADDAICNDMGRLGVSYKFDCKFIVGSDPEKAETVFGCKYLFAIESPVFEKMLFGDFQEAQNPTDGIPLPDDDPKVVRHFRLLTCASSDRASLMQALSLDETLNLAQFCHKYMTLSVFKLCTDRLLTLCETATPMNLIKMFGVTRIISGVLHIKVVEKLHELEYPVTLTTLALNELDQDAFSTYLQQYIRMPRYSNVNLFNAIDGYIKKNALIPKNLLDNEEIEEKTKDEKKSAELDPENLTLQDDKMKLFFLRKLLNLIDFSKFDARAFISGPGNSNILSAEQKYYVLSSIFNSMTPIKLFEQ